MAARCIDWRASEFEWSSGKPAKVLPAAPTEFERQAKLLGLTEQSYETSQPLRN